MAAGTLTKAGTKQRLVVCLDGTWNNRDDCTNVLHAFNLVHEGVMPDGVVQRRYYDEGVGTGVLDRVSGGGFGNGLEINVREVYDWLVQHYRDGDDVFVFGFSRGAFTARSLVGFIARCGLLYRGAPLTVRQLWQGYGELQREKEGTETFWDRTLKKGAFRQLEKLKSDEGMQPRWQRDDLNDTEQLLVAWSRRIPIRFVGIFDTVGALGLDALAIPGLRGRAGRVHNMRPTSLVQRCCHALALDENRGSFGHTPILQFIGCGPHLAEDRAAPEPPEIALEHSDHVDWGAERTAWENESKQWQQRWEQRWFVGAHANVGGGYEDNPLARIPLAWLLTEASDAGLGCDVPAIDPAGQLPAVRDSFREFGKPWWTWLVRGRRNYRALAPGPEPRAARARPGMPPWTRPGFVLEPINERIDESVWAFARLHTDYAPPALIAYAKSGALGPAMAPERAAIAERAIEHEWPASVAGGHLVVVAWAILAGVGWTYADDVFLVQPVYKVAIGTGVACVAGVVDWAESRSRLIHALRRPLYAGADGHGKNPPLRSAVLRAVADSLYWLRVVGVVLVLAGGIGLTWRFFSLGWRADTGYRQAVTEALEILARWWPLPVCAVVTTVIAAVANWWLGPVNGPRQRKPFRALTAVRALDGSIGAGAVIVSGCLLLAVIGQTWRRLWMHVGNAPAAPLTEFPGDVLFAGHFLLLVVLLACFCNTLLWAGEPMRRANLGNMTQLQGPLRFGLPLPPFLHGAEVAALLRRWVDAVRVRWQDPAHAEAAAVRSIQRIAGESLCRDCIGFVPLYSLVFAFGLWFAAHDVGFAWLARYVAGAPVWLWLIGVTAAADWTETLLHLGYLRRTDEAGRAFTAPRTGVVCIAAAATIVKIAGFVTASVTTIAAAAIAGLQLFDLEHVAGWRGLIGAAIVLLAGLIAAWLAFSLWTAAVQRRRNARRPRHAGRSVLIRP